MKFKKIIWIMTICLALVGCTDATERQEISESKEPFTIQLFYSKTCPHCKQLKEELLPEIEEEFKDQVTIEQYDIDDEASIELYNQYIGIYDPDTKTWIQEGLLANVDEDSASSNYYIPLMVVSDQYAFMGYTNSLKQYYLQDIHLMLQGKPLTAGDVSVGRWLFKKS